MSISHSSTQDDHSKTSTEQPMPPAAVSTNHKDDVPVEQTREILIQEATGGASFRMARKSGTSHEENRLGIADENNEPPMTTNRFMCFVAMAFLWTGAQIPSYLWGGIPPIVYSDIGGADRWVWFITGNLLASAAVCPFVGALSDLLGRRYVALLGAVLIILGQAVCTTARDMNVFVAGMAVSGVGSGIAELTALAGTVEMVPTARRGVYLALLILSVLPFCPSVLWAQLIAAGGSWRYVGILTAAWNLAGLGIVSLFYFPPPRVNSLGLSARDIAARVDFLGGFLSIAGIILFDAGLLWGGYQYAWTSAHVLVPLLLGLVLMAAFVAWEIWGARFPMFPRRLGREPRTLVLTLIITFISGANFFSVLMLWPSQAYNVYGHDPVGVGLRGLPFAMGVLAGCIVTLALLTKFRGGNKWLLFGASCVMTAGCGALAAARLDNVSTVYAILVIAGLGVGGIVVPASLISTIICPDDLIATVTALTLAVRVIGGAIGYSIYYNVFVSQLVPLLGRYIGGTMERAGITDVDIIAAAIQLTGASQLDAIAELPGVAGNAVLWDRIVAAGQLAYSEAYPYVYYCSIAFGVVSMITSLFMGDIEKFMDDHVAVIIN